MMDDNDAKKKGEILEKGIKIVDSGNTEIKVNYLISDKGGQGDVYHVSYKGKDYALKWYCKHPDDVIGGAQHTTITKICGENKKPGPEFIWPLFLVTESNPANGKQFGYLMEVLPKGYYEMEDFLRMDGDSKRVGFNSWNSMLVAGMNIAAAMQKLHLKGLSYKDLNPKNFMFNPENGSVLVVDNDNVSVDGDLCSVKGTKGYMAPEIPRSNYKRNPSTKTDYYSLAVVLYRLFFIDHPMEGKAWEKYPLCTDQVEDYLYAAEPIFHFDPNNDSNRPTDVYAPNATARWKVIPSEIKTLFVKSFTEGVNDPNKRVPENALITELSKSRDKLIRLNPQREQFVNFSDKRSVPPRCLGMKVHNNQIALYPQKAIYQISVDGNVHQYANISAGVVYDKNQDKLVLRNLTNKVWRHFYPGTGKLTDIGKGQQCPLFPGVMIEFQREKPKIVGEIFDPTK
jgi:protein kinase family protein